MAVWKPRWSAKGLDLGLELGLTRAGEVAAERLRGERVGALGRVGMGEGVEDGELLGDWRGEC